MVNIASKQKIDPTRFHCLAKYKAGFVPSITNMILLFLFTMSYKYYPSKLTLGRSVYDRLV